VFIDQTRSLPSREETGEKNSGTVLGPADTTRPAVGMHVLSLGLCFHTLPKRNRDLRPHCRSSKAKLATICSGEEQIPIDRVVPLNRLYSDHKTGRSDRAYQQLKDTKTVGLCGVELRAKICRLELDITVRDRRYRGKPSSSLPQSRCDQATPPGICRCAKGVSVPATLHLRTLEVSRQRLNLGTVTSNNYLDRFFCLGAGYQLEIPANACDPFFFLCQAKAS